METAETNERNWATEAGWLGLNPISSPSWVITGFLYLQLIFTSPNSTPHAWKGCSGLHDLLPHRRQRKVTTLKHACLSTNPVTGKSLHSAICGVSDYLPIRGESFILTLALTSFMINVLKSFLKDDFVIFNIAHSSNQTQGLAHHARTRILPLSSDTGSFPILKQL